MIKVEDTTYMPSEPVREYKITTPKGCFNVRVPMYTPYGGPHLNDEIMMDLAEVIGKYWARRTNWIENGDE